MSKILFLDVDGVLNNYTTKEMFAGTCGIDQRLLCLFQDWFSRQSDVNIVLSSSWRLSEAHCVYLRDQKIRWIDQTPRFGWRGLEIADWLSRNSVTYGVTGYAILDDTNNMKPVGSRLVQTSPIHGVRSKNLLKVEQKFELLYENNKTNFAKSGTE